jgi:hypothetical protein
MRAVVVTPKVTRPGCSTVSAVPRIATGNDRSGACHVVANVGPSVVGDRGIPGLDDRNRTNPTRSVNAVASTARSEVIVSATPPPTMSDGPSGFPGKTAGRAGSPATAAHVAAACPMSALGERLRLGFERRKNDQAECQN